MAERASRGSTHGIKRGVLFFSLFCLFPLIREYLHFPEFVRITFPNRYTLFTSFSAPNGDEYPLGFTWVLISGFAYRLFRHWIRTFGCVLNIRLQFACLLTFSSSFLILCTWRARVRVCACVHEITLERIRVSLRKNVFHGLNFITRSSWVAHSNSQDLPFKTATIVHLENYSANT